MIGPTAVRCRGRDRSLMHGLLGGVRRCLRPVCGTSSLGRGARGAPRCGRLSVLAFVCLVVADCASCGSTDETMMTGKMSCGAAHQSALDAPFGLAGAVTATSAIAIRAHPKVLLS